MMEAFGFWHQENIELYELILALMLMVKVKVMNMMLRIRNRLPRLKVVRE